MKKYSLMILVALLVWACDKAGEEETKDPNQIHFSAIHPSVATRVDDAGFEANDKIGIFGVEYVDNVALPLQVGGNFLNNEPLTYLGNKWTPGRKLYWSTGALDFYAYYPYTRVNSVNALIYELAADQRVPRTDVALGGYEASDFLYAKVVNATRTGGDVVLRFEHVMTKMKIQIVKGTTFEGELPEDISVNIYNTVTTATIDLVKGSATKYAYGSKKTIQAKRTAPAVFEAIVVPQYIDALTPLVGKNG